MVRNWLNCPETLAHEEHWWIGPRTKKDFYCLGVVE